MTKPAVVVVPSQYSVTIWKNVPETPLHSPNMAIRVKLMVETITLPITLAIPHLLPPTTLYIGASSLKRKHTPLADVHVNHLTALVDFTEIKTETKITNCGRETPWLIMFTS